MRVTRSRQGGKAPWIRALLLGAAALCGCPGGDDRVAVVVTPVLPAGLEAARFSVEAFLDEMPASEGAQLLEPDKVPFTLVLPAGTRGALRVRVTAADADSLLIARGNLATTLVLDEKDYTLPVPLTAVSCGSAFCYNDPKSRDTSLNAVFAVASDEVYAVGDGGVALRYDGFAWASVQTGTQQNLNGVWGSGPGDVRFVGDFGAIVKYLGGREVSPMTTSLRAIWGTAKDDIWAVGESGTVLHYDGMSWQVEGVDIGAQLEAVWGTAPNDVWAAGQGGALVHFDGSRWTVESSMTTTDLFAVGGTGEGLFLGGLNGSLLRRQGTTWQQVPSSGTRTIHGLYGGDQLYAASEAGTVLAGGSGGLKAAALQSPPLYSITGDSDGAIWAVGALGTIVRGEGESYVIKHRGPGLASLRPPRGAQGKTR